MNTENRKAPRIPLIAKVKVMHPEFGDRILKSMDISDGGMFILSADDEWPEIGTQMQVQALDTPIEAEVLNVRLVRKMPNGIGVKFTD